MAEKDTRPTSSGVPESRWSQLPAEILGIISKRLDDAIGNLRLRSVCANWRDVVPLSKHGLKISFKPGFPTFIYPKQRGHFSLSSSTIYLLQSAAVEGNEAARSTSPWWLLRVEAKNLSGKFRPLSPFSRTLTEDHFPKGFPRALNLLDVRVHQIGKAYSLDFFELGKQIETNLYVMRSRKVVVSSSGEGDYAILALFRGKLGFIKSGDKNWSPIDDPKGSIYEDILYSEQKEVFYALGNSGRLIMIDRDLKAKEVVPAMPFGFRQCQNRHMIESNGELFLVNKYDEPELYMCNDDDDGDDDYGDDDDGAFEIDGFSFKYTNLESPLHLKVYKLVENDWEYVRSLGDRVFFIGDDCSYAVSAQRFGLEENCIYFTANEFLGDDECDAILGKICPDAGVYCLKDGSCGSLASFPEHAQIFLNSPAWLKAPKTKDHKSKGKKLSSKAHKSKGKKLSSRK